MIKNTLSEDIRSYNAGQSGVSKEICQLLAEVINENLANSENKVWHRHPVWFLDGNPVVGYGVLKDCVQLLFWSGQSFDEPGLEKEGTFKASQARYTSIDQVNTTDLKRWLKKAEEIQWDYKNIVKRRGVLERLK